MTDYAIFVATRSLVSLVVLGASFFLLRYLYTALFHLFLHESDDGDEVEIVGRFPHATSCYIASMVLLLIGTVVGLVWGASILWKIPKLMHWVYKGVTKKWVLKVGRDEVIGLVQVGKMGLFILSGIIASIGLRASLMRYLFAIFLVGSGARAVIGRIVHYCVFFLFFFVGLQHIGLGAHVWQLVLVTSFAITLGIKDTILDIFAGVWLLFERSIEPTHFIEINNIIGVVKDIGVRKTLIATERGIVLVPNRDLISKVLINWSKVNVRMGKRDFQITLDRSLSIATVKEKAEEVFKDEIRVYNMPQTRVILSSFSPSGATYTIRLAIKRKYFLEQASILNDCKEALYNSLLG